MEQTECSETSAYKIQTPGNYPEEAQNKFKDLRMYCSNFYCSKVCWNLINAWCVTSSQSLFQYLVSSPLPKNIRQCF